MVEWPIQRSTERETAMTTDNEDTHRHEEYAIQHLQAGEDPSMVADALRGMGLDRVVAVEMVDSVQVGISAFSDATKISSTIFVRAIFGGVAAAIIGS